MSGVLNDVFVFGLFAFGGPTSSSTVVMFSSVHACFRMPLSCLWSVLTDVYRIFSNVSSPFFLQFVFENCGRILQELCFFKLIQVLNQSFVLLDK